MRADQTRPAPQVNTYDSNLISTITVTLVVQFLCDFLISEDRITDSFHTSLNKKKSSRLKQIKSIKVRETSFSPTILLSVSVFQHQFVVLLLEPVDAPVNRTSSV